MPFLRHIQVETDFPLVKIKDIPSRNQGCGVGVAWSHGNEPGVGVGVGADQELGVGVGVGVGVGPALPRLRNPACNKIHLFTHLFLFSLHSLTVLSASGGVLWSRDVKSPKINEQYKYRSLFTLCNIAI